MAFAPNFDAKLKQALDVEASGYRWKTGWSAVGQRWKVDVAGLKGETPRVLVEVELKKDNPVENVVKIWRWAAQGKSRKRILFLQVFSGHYVKTRPFSSPPTKVKQYERAIFIGERMKADRSVHVHYAKLAMKFRPRMVRGKSTKEGGGAMHRAAKELGSQIAKMLRSS